MKTKSIVINACFGGFGLSQAAYAKLIKWGIPARRYMPQKRHPKTHRYSHPKANEGEVIFDHDLTPVARRDKEHASSLNCFGRYWETWLKDKRDHPLLVRVVKKLGDKANGHCAKLKIVEIPAEIQFDIAEYDGNEHVAQNHQTWR